MVVIWQMERSQRGRQLLLLLRWTQQAAVVPSWVRFARGVVVAAGWVGWLHSTWLQSSLARLRRY